MSMLKALYFAMMAAKLLGFAAGCQHDGSRCIDAYRDCCEGWYNDHKHMRCSGDYTPRRIGTTCGKFMFKNIYKFQCCANNVKEEGAGATNAPTNAPSPSPFDQCLAGCGQVPNPWPAGWETDGQQVLATIRADQNMAVLTDCGCKRCNHFQEMTEWVGYAAGACTTAASLVPAPAGAPAASASAQAARGSDAAFVIGTLIVVGIAFSSPLRRSS